MFSSASLNLILQNDTLHSSSYGSEDSAEMTLRGSVVVNTRSHLKIRRIYLHFGGKLSFTYSLKKTRRILADQTITLTQHKRADGFTGQRTFPFQILIPGDLPETFVGQSGKIKYTLKAVVETTFATSDLKAEVPVYIQRNLYTLEAPSNEEFMIEKTFRNQITCQISLPTTDYTVGEKFDIQVSMSAMDPKIHVKNVTCTLKEFIQYHVPSSSNPSHILQAKYLKILDSRCEQYGADEHTKSLIVKIPENANFSCVNQLIEIYHELSVRAYFVSAEGTLDYANINVPINTVSFAATVEYDQLPLYYTIELPPSYQVATHCMEELTPITPTH